MPATKTKTGGRRKGTPNKRTLEVQEKLDKMKCDPIEGMAQIANGECECHGCFGDGKVTRSVFAKLTKGTVGNLTTNERRQKVECPICGGDGWERIPWDLRGQCFKELAQYVAPKRKAIEHTGSGGGPLVVERVTFAESTDTA